MQNVCTVILVHVFTFVTFHLFNFMTTVAMNGHWVALWYRHRVLGLALLFEALSKEMEHRF